MPKPGMFLSVDDGPVAGQSLLILTIINESSIKAQGSTA
jgi:hypothetical protein